MWNLREVEWNVQTPTSGILWILLWILRIRLRECHFQRIWRLRHCVSWQRTPMRMLLSSCTAQRSASERFGTFSQSCERETPLCRWDLIMRRPWNMCWKTHVNKCTLSTVTHVWKLLHLMIEVKTVFEPYKKWYSVRKMQFSRWALSFQSNILFSRWWCDTVSGSWIIWCAMILRLSWTIRVTMAVLLRDQPHFSIVSWSVDTMMTTKNQDFIQHSFLVWLVAQMGWLLCIQTECRVIMGEWRVSPLNDPESNLRELKSGLALMTEVDSRTLGCKTCQGVRYHKGWHSSECRERVLPLTVPDTMWPVASTERLLDTGAGDARDDHESKRHENSDETLPMAQEPSSGSDLKRPNSEAIRSADAEAETAM